MDKWVELKENNQYEININGKVRNKITKKELNYWKTTTGYYTIWLSKNGKGKTYYLHRLIANNFIPNPNNYNEVNHIDGNKQNNKANNLEWCSHKHNMLHAYNNKLLIIPKGKNNRKSKKVKQTNIINGEITIWDSMIDAKRELNYSVGSICDACKKNIKTYKNSIWEYV